MPLKQRMKKLCALCLGFVILVLSGDATAQAPKSLPPAGNLQPPIDPQAEGILGLVEIHNWEPRRLEPDEDRYDLRHGILVVETVESAGGRLPAKFRLEYLRGGKEGATPWDELRRSPWGIQVIGSGEWLVARFLPHGESWTVVPDGTPFAVARPEDLPAERLPAVQAHFKTPLIRTWVPEVDALAETLQRVRWGMSEEEFERAFKGGQISRTPWELTWDSFRRTITVSYPNTAVIFEFSGEVAMKDKAAVPVSSALLKFKVLHPTLYGHPSSFFQVPGANRHYQYLWSLLQNYKDALANRRYGRENSFLVNSHWHSGCISLETVAADPFGRMDFILWSNTHEVGVFAEAPLASITGALEKEKASVDLVTQDWPDPTGEHISLKAFEAPETLAGQRIRVKVEEPTPAKE